MQRLVLCTKVLVAFSCNTLLHEHGFSQLGLCNPFQGAAGMDCSFLSSCSQQVVLLNSRLTGSNVVSQRQQDKGSVCSVLYLGKQIRKINSFFKKAKIIDSFQPKHSNESELEWKTGYGKKFFHCLASLLACKSYCSIDIDWFLHFLHSQRLSFRERALTLCAV